MSLPGSLAAAALAWGLHDVAEEILLSGSRSQGGGWLELKEA
jgi:hypothetical protein